MYNSLHDQTNENCLKATKGAISICAVIYTAVAFIGIAHFGSIINQNVLHNMAAEKEHWESYLLRFVFLVVLICHVPFIFFVSKESMLIIIDEYQRKTISKALTVKIREYDGMHLRTQTNADSLGENDIINNISDLKISKMKIHSVGMHSMMNPKEPLLKNDTTLNQSCTTSKRSAMAYKEMPYWVYFTSTTLCYGILMLGSIYITDIGLIFEFISAISGSCLAFIFPGWFYLLAERKYASIAQKKKNKNIRIQSIVFVILGLFSFVI